VDAEADAGVDVEKKKKMKKKKKLLRHNPEVQVEREKLTRYDDHSIDARIDFINALLDDKDLEWSRDGEAERVSPRTDGDFMAAVERRAEEARETSAMKDDVIKELDML